MTNQNNPSSFLLIHFKLHYYLVVLSFTRITSLISIRFLFLIWHASDYSIPLSLFPLFLRFSSSSFLYVYPPSRTSISSRKWKWVNIWRSVRIEKFSLTECFVFMFIFFKFLNLFGVKMLLTWIFVVVKSRFLVSRWCEHVHVHANKCSIIGVSVYTSVY